MPTASFALAFTLKAVRNEFFTTRDVLAAEHEDDKSVASVSAVLFFVLALQTGLTGMESEKRFQQICKNLCLLVTAILHFVHSTVQPVLMSISASRSNNRSSHIRVMLASDWSRQIT